MSIKRNKIFLQIIILISFSSMTFGQKIYTYNSPGAACYSQTIFLQKNKTTKGVMVISVREEDVQTYALDNPFLNSQLFEEYNFLYIHILDEKRKNSNDCVNIITTTRANQYKIHSDVFYYLNEKGKTDSHTNSQKNEIQKVFYSDNHLEKLKFTLDSLVDGKKYFKDIELSEEKRDSIKMRTYKGNIDASITFGPHVLTGNKLGVHSDVIGLLGINIKKNISKSSSLILGVNYTQSNKTKVENELLNSEKKDTVYSHGIIGGEFMYRKYVIRKNKWNFFVSSGAGYYSVYNVNMKRKTKSLYQEDYVSDYISPLAEIGFDYRITPVISVNGIVPLKYFLSTKSADLNTFSWGINFGVSFTLNTNKSLKL